MKNTLNRQL